MRQLEFRKFRFLFIVFGLTLLAAIWELTEPDASSNPQRRSFPQMWADLYPESADSHYTKAREYAEQGNLAEARVHFEQAIAKGEKTNEDLYYEYAVLLVRMRADRESIDRAIATWRRCFPFSPRPDPLEAADPS